MVTDVTFDARNDQHAVCIAHKQGWELVGELLSTVECAAVTEAMMEKFYATVH